MALLESCSSLSKSFGSRILFENIALGISEGERLGLIGRNGSGKTTLLKILSGQLDSDSGEISMRRNTRVGYVPQETVFPEGQTAGGVVAQAIAGEKLEPPERADLKEMRRLWVHTAAVPKELLATKTRLSQHLQSVWNRAKPQNDWNSFAPPFAELLSVVRENRIIEVPIELHPDG